MKMIFSYCVRLACLAAVLVAASCFSWGCFASEVSDLITNVANAYKQGDYDLAVADCSKLIELGAKDGYYGRARAYYQKQKYDKAIADLDREIQSNPVAAAFELRGNAYFKIENYKNARADYDKALQLDSQNQKLLLDRAAACVILHDYNAALIDYSAAILLLSDSPGHDGLLAQAYDERGVAYYLQHDDKSLDDFDQSIKLNPNESNAYSHRADVWFNKQEFSRAFEDYNSAIKLNSQDAMVYARRGELNATFKKDYPAGIKDCIESIRLNPNYWLGYNNLAALLAICPDEKIRDGQRALPNARKACELTLWKKPRAIGTLAAAYAETGDYAEAIKWHIKSIGMETRSETLEHTATERLNLYEQNKPFRTLEN